VLEIVRECVKLDLSASYRRFMGLVSFTTGPAIVKGGHEFRYPA
jgi:hypothetical protein